MNDGEDCFECLTERQREILQLMVSERLSYREIALRLGIGYRTVINHMVAIYEKLRLQRGNALQAIIVAWQRGEISL